METWLIAKDIIETALTLTFTGALVYYAYRQSNINKKQKDIQLEQTRIQQKQIRIADYQTKTEFFDKRYRYYLSYKKYINSIVDNYNTISKRKLEEYYDEAKFLFNDDIIEKISNLNTNINSTVQEILNNQPIVLGDDDSYFFGLLTSLKNTIVNNIESFEKLFENDLKLHSSIENEYLNSN